jgi:ABC-2 type transport system ATP-binding protein
VISVSHLTKRYGPMVAVDDVSFTVGKGEVVGFLGPNGAGKSSTLRILAGFLGPTSGEVTIDGHDVVSDSFEARRRIGYMPESVPLYPEMRVIEYLRFRAELKRVPGGKRAGYVDEALRKAGVVDVAHKRIGHLSKGYRQRVGLADAVVARPPIVILDEPTAGLDPNQIIEARALVKQLGEDHTVIVSTHILSEVEACATRVVLLNKGKLAAQGTVEELRALRRSSGDGRSPALPEPGRNLVTFVVRGDAARAMQVLGEVRGVSGVARRTGVEAPAHFEVTLEESLAAGDRAGAVEACVAALVGAGLGVQEVRPASGSLEDVFAALTASPAGGGEA